MKKLLILIAAIVISAAASPLCKAQPQLFRTYGFVRVENEGYPIAGAVVKFDDISCSTITDVNGYYEFRVPFENEPMTCSAEFFEPAFGEQRNVVNFDLQPESEEHLSEIMHLIDNVLTVMVGIYLHYGEPGYGPGGEN